jgi:uncharacterized RDD family membrane protein YckC
MSREILVATPENIEIEYELGGVGSRFLANLIDSVFQVLIIIGFVILFSLIGGLLELTNLVWANAVVNFVKGIIGGISIILLSLIYWGYFIWFEIAWNGQTPGKRQLGLRVVRDGGYPVTPYSVITRNLLRVIDVMPLFTPIIVIVGLFYRPALPIASLAAVSILQTCGFMLGTARYQRLGDFVAGTMVVKQRAPRVPTLEALAPPPRVLPEHLASYALADIGRHVYEMTVPEYRAVRHTIDRRWQLPPQVQQFAAMRLAVPLMERLGIRPPAGVQYVNYADFLEYLAVAFEQYRGVK